MAPRFERRGLAVSISTLAMALSLSACGGGGGSAGSGTPTIPASPATTTTTPTTTTPTTTTTTPTTTTTTPTTTTTTSTTTTTTSGGCGTTPTGSTTNTGTGGSSSSNLATGETFNGGTGKTAVLTTVPAGGYNDAEYRRSSGAVSSGAINQWNAGATGAGVTVALVDSGINSSSAEFAGRINSASRDVAGNRGINDSDGHGTSVAAVVGAARNGALITGVAFDSSLLVLRTDTPDSCASGCTHADANLATAIDVARANGARVINMSLGGGAPSSGLTAAIGRATAAGIIVVISAGNDGAANPDDFALVANNAAVSRGLVMIAGASDASGTLASFSNKAGSGATYYLTAQGERVRSFDATGTSYDYSGTSYSAPVISGAVALLAQAYPNLSGTQIVNLLLSTAIDAGDAGTDSVYGRGLLDLSKAFQPQGATSMAGGKVAVSLEDNGTLGAAMGDAASRSGASLSGAIILDGYSRAYALDLAGTLSAAPRPTRLAGALDVGYRSTSIAAKGTSIALTIGNVRNTSTPWVGLAQTRLSRDDADRARAVAGFVAQKLSDSSNVALGLGISAADLRQRLNHDDGGAFLIANTPGRDPGFDRDDARSALFRHQIGKLGVTVASESGNAQVGRLAYRPDDRGYQAGSVTFDRRFGPARIAAGFGLVRENNTLLGSTLGSAFGVTGGTTRYAEIEARVALGSGWSVAGDMRNGWSTARLSQGLTTGSGMRTMAFSADIAKDGVLGGGDRLALRLAQPTRVESGGLKLNLPVAYDYASLGTITAARRFNLTPSGRELDLEASYARAISTLGGGWVGANLYMRRQPNHVAAADADVGAALRFSLAF